MGDRNENMEPWLNDAIALAECLVAIKFPKGTRLRGDEVILPSGRSFHIVPVTDSETLTVHDYEEVLRDHRRLVREIDVIINGEDGAARQASLCDLVRQIQQLVNGHGG